MKKTLLITLAVAITMVFAAGAMAANTVQMTLTSPTIVKTGCEKAGAVTFAFQENSVVSNRDWWYMDLPNGVTICSPINFIIAGNNAAVSANASNTAANNTAGFGGIATTTLAAANITPASRGPITTALTGTNGANGTNGVVRTGGNMVISVVGAMNSRRVTLTALSDTAAAQTSNLHVQQGYTMFIKILDGQAHNSVAAAGDSMILLDSNSNGIFQDATTATDDLIGYRAGTTVPYIENTLCINATQYAGDLVFVSFASLNDKFTFTGDSQIAHVAAANAITLNACKGVTTGEIPIAAQGTCSFDYELHTNYCATSTFSTQTMPWGGIGGNKYIIKGASVFGDIGDSWLIYLYSDTPGVYFTAAPVMSGYTPTVDPCSLTFNSGAVAIAPAWTPYNESSAVATAYAGTTCTVPAANRVREVRSATFTNIHTVNAIEVNIPVMAYDTSVIGNGTEAKVRVSFRKYPCGEIFTASRTIGTFVTTCSAASGTTTLMFPFFPPLNGSTAGWWGGFIIVNRSTLAGTIALTFTEADGDIATYTTPSVAAGASFNPGSMSSLLALLTPAAGNTGTFGDKNCSAVAVCNFSNGGAFAFVGSPTGNTGYTAYVRPGSGWN